MADPINQIERDRVYGFVEAVQAIRQGHSRGIPLSEYWPREIAGMHEQTEKLLVDLVLGAVERGSMERVTSAGKKVGTSPPD